jgi:hypothetical protein
VRQHRHNRQQQHLHSGDDDDQELLQVDGDLLNQDRHQHILSHQLLQQQDINDSNQYINNQQDTTTTLYQDGDFLQLDDNQLWTQGDAFGASSAPPLPNDDFDWTALGLDPFGTQLLLVPSLPGSGTTSSATPDQDPLDLFVDSLPDAGLFFGDLTVPSLDDPSMTMAAGGDHHHHHHHLFPDSLLNHLPPSMLDHQSAFTPANTSTGGSAAHQHPSPTFSSSSHGGHSSSLTNDGAYTASSSSSKSKTKKHAAGSGVGADVGGASGGDLSEDSGNVKRQRNTMAARRYRQRRLDRLSELEQKLAEMTADRDDLRVKLARREAEVGALREVLTVRK